MFINKPAIAANMAGPNLDKLVTVVVCDPQGEIFEGIMNHLSQKHESRYSRLWLERADSIEQIVEAIPKNKPVQYGLVIYEGSVLKDKIGRVSRVHKRDPFMPQMIVPGNNPMDVDLAMQASRAGVLYYGENDEQIEKYLHDIFCASRHFREGVVVKIGGSAFDYQR